MKYFLLVYLLLGYVAGSALCYPQDPLTLRAEVLLAGAHFLLWGLLVLAWRHCRRHDTFLALGRGFWQYGPVGAYVLGLVIVAGFRFL